MLTPFSAPWFPENTCWICSGWSSEEFEYVHTFSGPPSKSVVRLHLSLAERCWETSVEMKRGMDDSGVVVDRASVMVPPGNVQYYFWVDDKPRYANHQSCETVKAQVLRVVEMLSPISVNGVLCRQLTKKKVGVPSNRWSSTQCWSLLVHTS